MNQKLTRLQKLPPWDWPEDAFDTLVKTFHDPASPLKDRVTAAELAGELTQRDDALASELLKLVRTADAPAEVRIAGAISLGPILEEAFTEGFDDYSEPIIEEELVNQIQSTLQQLYQDTSGPKLLRRRMLEASVRAPQDWHHEAIRSAFASTDPDWKLTAAFCMGYVKGFNKEILQLLQHTDEKIRRQAMHAAGNFEVAEAWPAVAAVLNSKSPDKYMLLTAIGASGINAEKAEPILERLTRSKDEDIAGAAEEALAMNAELGNDDDFDLDEDLFDDDDDDDGPPLTPNPSKSKPS